MYFNELLNLYNKGNILRRILYVDKILCYNAPNDRLTSDGIIFKPLKTAKWLTMLFLVIAQR